MKNIRILLTAIAISGMMACQALADTSMVIAAGETALSTVTSTPATVYQPGRYQAGTDLPAGEYVVLAVQGESASPRYVIYENGSQDSDVVDYNVFEYNAIIRVEEGQVLELRDAAASPIDEVREIDHFYGNMYKVGYHIPEGTYWVSPYEGDYGLCYILSAPSDSYEVVLDYLYVYDRVAVSVEKGQYVQLIDCVLTGTAPAGAAKERESLQIQEDPLAAVTGDEGRSSMLVLEQQVPGLSYDTSQPATVYPEGKYHAGVDIPAGEYVLFDTSDENDTWDIAWYTISRVPEIDRVELLDDFAIFEYNAIINLEEGQYLDMSSCTASPIGEVTSLDASKAAYYKVGVHIPAGTYYLVPNEYRGIYSVRSAPGAMSEHEVKKEYVYNETASVTLEEGQYLIIADCRFTSPLGPGEGTKQRQDEDSSVFQYLADLLNALYGDPDKAGEREAASPVVAAPAE